METFYFKQGRLLAILAALFALTSHAYSQALDITGWRIIQTLGPDTITFPPGTTVARGGYVVIARNAAKTAFETFWGVTLPANVTYINSTPIVGSNGFPVINGSENYTLTDASSTIIDGPTVSEPAPPGGQSVQRRRPGYPAAQETSWTRLSSPNTNATPGSGAGLTTSSGLIINEFSDATGTGNFIYEFVELYYDVAPPPTGVGSAFTMPTLARGNILDTITVLVKSSGLTSLSYVDVVVPSSWSWSHSTSDITTTGGGTPSVSVSGDTIQLTGAAVTTTDSVTIQIRSLTPPDSTNLYPFNVLTGTAPDSILPLLTQPTVLVYGTPRPIADIKTNDVNGVPLLFGKYVTVRGFVTVANEFGSPSYIQDNTGGIGFFDVALSASLQPGDEIILTGTIAPFNGLCELSNLILQQTVSTGNSVEPLLVAASDIKNDGAGGVESYEGMLVRVNAATVTDTFGTQISNWSVSGSGTNYRLNDASGFVDIRVDNSVNFANTPAPQSSFDVIGVVSQFKAATPYIGGYQLMPRASADIFSKGPIFATAPYETDITPTSFRVHWTTVDSGTSRLRYGVTTSHELGVLGPDDLLRKNHAIDITGLTPATIYHVQAFSVKDPDTSTAGDLIVSTASPAGSTGQINVYFNKSVNTSVATVENALGNQDLVSRVLTRINNARRSIDLALYSLSGTGPGSVIPTALVAAKNRGVLVRVVCEADNRNTTAFNTLQSNGIPIITDAYDLVWAGQGLSHNKFFVFDARGGAPESLWVWAGSWNPTDPGTNADRQNSIEIQDVALAGAYMTEFNEMWGSSTDTPNQSQTRFGARKRDNTPHRFVINGVPVESYFSPSDHTTSHISSTLRQAQHSVAVAVLTFTRKDLADTLIARKNLGRKVRILIDNNTDTGNQFAYLQSNGMDVHLKVGTGLLHHKYATVDGDQFGGTQYAITGSHNWSNSAENSNDENTLIVQDPRIANLYLQEFAARYYESGGTDSIHVVTSPAFALAPASIDFGTLDTGLTKQDSVTVTNTGTAVLTVSVATSTNPVFSVVPGSAVVAPSGNQRFYISFSPVAGGVQTGSIVFTHNATGSPDTVAVTGTGHEDTAITTASIVYAIDSGWNMLSLPVKVADPRKSAIFPDAVSNAFAYKGIYVARDTLLNGAGYWLKFSSPRTDTVTGMPVIAETTQVSTGWNMIGPPSVAVLIGTIVQNPSNIVRSNYYGYGGAYFAEDTLKPGQAYWVKTSQGGTLSLPGPSAVPKTHPPDDLSQMNRLTVSDLMGHSQTLYFGMKPSESFSPEKYDTPPLPPAGAFDVRFASGKMAEIIADDLKAAAYPIAVQSPVFPIRIAWAIDSKDNNSYTLTTGGSAEILVDRLTGVGEMSLSRNLESMVLAVKPQRKLPEEYALGQNYPNPFNPVTTIPFSLPQASTVTLSIYNLLGEAVITILDRAPFDAGYYERRIDASHLASGIYFYRLDAVSSEKSETSFHQQKKLLLVK